MDSQCPLSAQLSSGACGSRLTETLCCRQTASTNQREVLSRGRPRLFAWPGGMPIPTPGLLPASWGGRVGAKVIF